MTGVPGADLGSHTASGFIGGGQIGCDYQAGMWVFGLQGMFEGSAMQGSNTDPSGLFVMNSQIPWLATVTGRVGVTAAPTVLVYAKGGGAWVRDNYTLAASEAALLQTRTTPNLDGQPVAALSGPSRETGRRLLNTTTLTSAHRA